MTVKDVMVETVKCCAAGDTLNRAAQLMWENDCGCVPVVDGDSRVIGMLTDRDICMAAYTQGATLNGIQVSSVMSREVFTCRSRDTLLVAQRAMREHRVRRLPVTDREGKLVGILSLNDIARAVARSAAGKAQVATTMVAICALDPHQAEPQSKELQDHLEDRPRANRRRRRSRGREPSTEGAPR